jgi:DNA-binding XRE family transcriptional regulator
MKHASRKPPVTNRLWRYRTEHQLSQRRIALMLGHKKTTQVSRWENGEKTPSLPNALKLGYILKVPVETLFVDLAAGLRGEIEARASHTSGAHRDPMHPNEKGSTK